MFEFDQAKSDGNRAKHGIDFDEAQALWLDEQKVMLPTARVRPEEQRWLVVGRIGDPIWTAVVTGRGEAIRIISVRRARKDEAEAYERQGN